MKETLAEILKVLSDKYHSPCCIAARPTGERLITIGSPSNLQYTGLFNLLFGDASAIVQSNDHYVNRMNDFPGQKLPLLWGQGEDACIVMKPLDDLLVGFFQQDKSVMQLVEEGNEISQKLADALGGAN